MSPAQYRRFLECWAVVCELEGGETAVELPGDTGGRTQFGVTARWHPQGWRDGRITIGEATDVAWASWVFIRGHHLPAPVDLAVLDWAFHDGDPDAARGLQRTLGVASDGHVGEVTRAALSGRTAAPNGLADAVCEERLRVYRDRGSRYLAAFERRVARLRAAWAEPAPAPRPMVA